MKPRILAVIPARFASKRFPGKPLSPIAGKSLIERLYLETAKSKLIDRVVVATDSQEIINGVREFGGNALLTSSKHRTGSDRTAETMRKIGGEIILNIQADHLGVTGRMYDRVLSRMLEDRNIEFATLAMKVESEDTLFNPNRVKLIMNSNGDAFWFSRYPLPYLQGVNGSKLEQFEFYYHIGVYFFRKKGLMQFASWPRSPHEKAESLEQLRILENHRRIKVFKIRRKVISIDAPEDLKQAEKHFLTDRS
jgi:3-deoxy-manno-octulosonate cytidylyltransferase (CMP-KDO synthetase)